MAVRGHLRGAHRAARGRLRRADAQSRANNSSPAIELSRIALARRLGRSVFALDTWDVKGLEVVQTPAEAVERALAD